MRLAYLLALLFVAGCSGFGREWKNAALRPEPARALAGRWEGHWMSQQNKHNGKLRCIVTVSTNDVHIARFHAKYWRILSFGYTVPLRVQSSNGVYRFEGEADLGSFAGGVYRYAGTVAGTNWNSTYQSRADHGYFRMSRAP